MALGSAARVEPEGDSRRKGKQLDRKSPRLQGSEAVGWLSWDWGQGLCVAMGKGSASQAAGHPAFTASGPDLTLCRHLLASPTCQVTEMTLWGLASKLRSNVWGSHPRVPHHTLLQVQLPLGLSHLSYPSGHSPVVSHLLAVLWALFSLTLQSRTDPRPCAGHSCCPEWWGGHPLTSFWILPPLRALCPVHWTEWWVRVGRYNSPLL